MTEVVSFEMQDEAEYARAVQAMESGDDTAKTKVAFFKLSGRGGAGVDVEGAVALLEERSLEGDGDAMWMLGLCCLYGMGAEKDIRKAFSLFRQSRETGNVVGKFLLRGPDSGPGHLTRNVRLDWGL